MSGMHTLSFVYGELRKAVSEAGGQSAFAAKHGLSASYVSDVMNARRDPGASVLAAIGLKKVVGYAKV